MCPIPGVHDNTAKMQSAAGFITAYMAGKFLINVGTTAEQNPAVVNASYVLEFFLQAGAMPLPIPRSIS